MKFVVKKSILTIIAVFLILATIIFKNFLTETTIGITVLVVLLLAYFVLTLFWCRCPHCNSYLFKLTPFQHIAHFVATNLNKNKKA